jgi:hypothetical protein
LEVVKYKVVDAKFEAAPPMPWSTVELADTGFIPNFDIEPTGNFGVAFLSAAGVGEEASSRQVTVITNFFKLLQRSSDSGR